MDLANMRQNGVRSSTGRLPATLAHDCRRTELFQGELLAALQIVQRGDLGRPSNITLTFRACEDHQSLLTGW
jgi:membrane-bound lytic murein transglycosylase B